MTTNTNTTTTTTATATATYYVVEARYSGANPYENEDYDRYEIRTEPSRRIGGDGSPCTEGWCGASNEASYYAHGEYHRLDDAVEVIKVLCGGEYREIETENKYGDDDVLATYKPGRFEPMNHRDLADYVAASFEAVEAATTDEAILEIAKELLDEAQENGSTFEIATLIEWLEDHRAEAREAEEE
jgi:hypothetical protein